MIGCCVTQNLSRQDVLSSAPDLMGSRACHIQLLTAYIAFIVAVVLLKDSLVYHHCENRIYLLHQGPIKNYLIFNFNMMNILHIEFVFS